MKRLRTRRASLILTGLAAASLLPFSALPQSQNDQSGTIRVITRLVNVSVVVQDKDGKPVTGLTKDDFTVLDRGQPQRIQFFSEVDNRPQPAAAPLPPDTYTNVLADLGEHTPSVSVLLFDALNSHWSAQGFALNNVREFLRTIPPGDHVGIYVLTDDNLKIIHDFTQNASDLLAAVARYDERKAHAKSPNATPLSTGDLELDRFLSGKDIHYNYYAEHGGGAGKMSFLYTQRDMTLAALAVIGRHLVSTPGRKSLIWVTDGIPEASFMQTNLETYLDAQSRGFTGNIDRMVRIMSDAGVAIYPVSAEGLQAMDLNFKQVFSSGATTTSSGLPVSVLQTPDPGPHMMMRELAERTGGRAFVNRNDIAMGIRRVLDDSRVSYSVAYVPDHHQWKGEFRKIQVKVNRPGVTVLARDGYFALPDAKPLANPKDRMAMLEQFAASPVDSTQFPLTVHIQRSANASGPLLLARVHFNLQSLLTRQADGRWSGDFEVVFLQIDAKNKLLDATDKAVDLNLLPVTLQNAAQAGADLPAQLKWMPRAAVLCVILRDKRSDTAGSVRIPLAKYDSPAAP